MAITRTEIEQILGPIDDHLAAEIAGTDATAQDLAKAMAWIEADEALVNAGDNLPTGKVAELIGILETVEEEDGAAPASAPAPDWT